MLLDVPRKKATILKGHSDDANYIAKNNNLQYSHVDLCLRALLNTRVDIFKVFFKSSNGILRFLHHLLRD